MKYDLSQSISQRGIGENNLLEKVILHNSIFPDTFYYFIGFAGYDGRSVMPEIETYMAAIGFTKKNHEGRFANNMYEVWDLVPRNVLKDKDGDIYVVDAEIKILKND